MLPAVVYCDSGGVIHNGRFCQCAFYHCLLNSASCGGVLELLKRLPSTEMVPCNLSGEMHTPADGDDRPFSACQRVIDHGNYQICMAAFARTSSNSSQQLPTGPPAFVGSLRPPSTQSGNRCEREHARPATAWNPETPLQKRFATWKTAAVQTFPSPGVAPMAPRGIIEGLPLPFSNLGVGVDQRIHSLKSTVPYPLPPPPPPLKMPQLEGQPAQPKQAKEGIWQLPYLEALRRLMQAPLTQIQKRRVFLCDYKGRNWPTYLYVPVWEAVQEPSGPLQRPVQ